MSYKTYTTEAIVCGSTHHNTSDKSYLLFSRDAGMLWATARSVREERSKQRYALQDFSRIRVSLVKGKSGWRIGSVEAHGNPFLSAESRMQRGRVNYVVSLLRRYVHGEVPLPKVYDDAVSILEGNTELQDKNVQIQQLFLARLLSELGYIAPDPQWKQVLETASVLEAVPFYTAELEAAVSTAVKEGAEASHL
jgi:recombinational DNA repair protein (RecF pathway)